MRPTEDRLSPTSYLLFSRVRAGDIVDGHDSVLLNTTVVIGEGIAPEIPAMKSARLNQRTWKNEFRWLCSTRCTNIVGNRNSLIQTPRGSLQQQRLRVTHVCRKRSCLSFFRSFLCTQPSISPSVVLVSEKKTSATSLIKALTSSKGDSPPASVSG